ncbi:MAG: nucleoside deaminase [Chloroflexi bacterium]|nr:nucleoside deaminase [Chloroflexota bacterium]
MDEFMKAALKQARIGAEEGGVPIGAALVRDGEIVATGRNRRRQDDSIVMHAEMNCIHNAGKSMNFDEFAGTTLYSTLMPCYMCAGAVLQFGIRKVVVGEAQSANEGYDIMLRHGIEVIDLDLDEAKELLAEYFRANPGNWTSHAAG